MAVSMVVPSDSANRLNDAAEQLAQEAALLLHIWASLLDSAKQIYTLGEDEGD